MPYLDPSSLPAAPDAPDLEAKVAGLAAFAREVLALHSADFLRPESVATHFSKPALQARSREGRMKLMAGPSGRERFAEVEHVEEGGTEDELASGGALDVRDRFRLWAYWGVRIDADDLGAEAAAFRAAMRATDPDRPGLVYALRRQDYFLHDGREMDVRVEGARYAFYEVDGAAREYRHEAQITITITGA